jgi:acyl carrier protein
MPEELVARVASVIAHTKKIPSESVTLDKTFQELGIDSLDGINIVFSLENEFDINVPDDAVREIKTVRQMVEGVEKLLAAKAS